MLSAILISTLLVSLSSFAGGLLLLKKSFFTKNISSYLVSFAAGILLTVVFFDILPEAQEHAEELNNNMNIFPYVFVGILMFFFLERFLLWFHHHDETHGGEPASILILLGDGLHNFIDGIVIAATFMSDPTLGVITTIAVAAHEIPQEIADFSILIHGGMAKSKALLYNFLSSLTSIVGAVGGYFFLQTISISLPYLLAFSAGMFIYIACSDLIPDLHKEFQEQRRWQQSVPFILGIIIAYTSVLFTHG